MIFYHIRQRHPPLKVSSTVHVLLDFLRPYTTQAQSDFFHQANNIELGDVFLRQN
ncbi:hypothetical protein [Candidatus Enterovibrio escicola]|uniref:Uncharacterized protein n=1 Tax=Candidatus Enterovibrio escicola TaxID=1927127 RepID=A0A2A5T2B3_9GAMM|nr:hypothetical protein [Candidatus Enterovibrio escacola]PCS22271.1 hypothetical protein BTN49_2000 [Candidatus Enterovibrio escacola]